MTLKKCVIVKWIKNAVAWMGMIKVVTNVSKLNVQIKHVRLALLVANGIQVNV